MAQVANTFETYNAVGNREELSDMIYQITPEETPFLSLIGKESVSSVHPEWQVDELATPDTGNNKAEGQTFATQAISPTERVGNYCQISTKAISVTRTQDKTSKAGRKSELAREVRKKGVELRTDMEVIALSNQASSAGSADEATNRTLGGMRAWLETNDSLGASGASGGFSGGVVGAATNGTQRAFTKALMDEVILDTYNAGGSPKTLMVSPYNKTVFSTFMSDANVVPLRKSATNDKNVIIGSAEVYHSDFGDVTVVPNRQMARAGATIARNIFLIDPKAVKLGVFDDIKPVKLSKTSDSEERAMVCEYTLCVKNEKSHGVIADTFGMSASS